MTARRLVCVAAAALAAGTWASPAQAWPPLVVSGAIVVWPPPGATSYASLSFTGTATDVLSFSTYQCSITGSGSVTASVVTGTASGACGPHVFPWCSFTLTPTSWTLTCTNVNGSFGVTQQGPGQYTAQGWIV